MLKTLFSKGLEWTFQLDQYNCSLRCCQPNYGAAQSPLLPAQLIFTASIKQMIKWNSKIGSQSLTFINRSLNIYNVGQWPLTRLQEVARDSGSYNNTTVTTQGRGLTVHATACHVSLTWPQQQSFAITACWRIPISLSQPWPAFLVKFLGHARQPARAPSVTACSVPVKCHSHAHDSRPVRLDCCLGHALGCQPARTPAICAQLRLSVMRAVGKPHMPGQAPWSCHSIMRMAASSRALGRAP